MRTRARSLAAVVAFALLVGTIAVLARRGGGTDLVKLPAAALGGDESGAGAASTRSASFPVGKLEYRVQGDLPDLPGSAPAYRLGAATTEGAVQRLARILGLDGRPEVDGDSWVVRSGDRELRVDGTHGLPWYLGPACPDAPVSSGGGRAEVACAAVTGVATPDGGGISAGSEGGCPPGAECATRSQPAVPPDCPDEATCVPPAVDPGVACPPEADCTLPAPGPGPGGTADAGRPAGLPSEREARRLAGEVFARLGVDAAGMTVDDGWSTWEARVDSSVDGLPVVGTGTAVSIGVDGQVVRASGFLATPDRIGDYPLAGVEAGLDRLRGGAGGWSAFDDGPSPLPAGAEPAGGEPADAPGAAAEPADAPGADARGVDAAPCGGPTVTCVPTEAAPEPVVQVVTGVRLGLLHLGDALVPAYLFDLEGGGMIPVPAVVERWLDGAATR